MQQRSNDTQSRVCSTAIFDRRRSGM
jgi:hypothetical protein